MKILVNIKSVFEDIQSLDPNLLMENYEKKEPELSSKINRFDDHALEEAIKLKEKDPDIEVHTVCIGNEKDIDTAKKTIGKGADKAWFILLDKDLAYDIEIISSILHKIFIKNSYDMIFLGMMSEDMMWQATGHLLGGKLDIPSVSGVVGIKEINKDKIIVKREIEGGITEEIQLDKKSVLNFQAGINKPSYPNVLKLLKSDSSITTIKAGEIIDVEKSFETESVSLPAKLRKAEFVNGSLEDKAGFFIELLKKKKIIQEK